MKKKLITIDLTVISDCLENTYLVILCKEYIAALNKVGASMDKLAKKIIKALEAFKKEVN